MNDRKRPGRQVFNNDLMRSGSQSVGLVNRRAVVDSQTNSLPLIEAGLKDAVAPVGKPLVPSETLPVKPFSADVETV
jgi:hypothetical protein